MLPGLPPGEPDPRVLGGEWAAEEFVRLWRAHGTRDPAALALLGFGQPELALLAADEDGASGP
jgi:hypothetical protein